MAKRKQTAPAYREEHKLHCRRCGDPFTLVFMALPRDVEEARARKTMRDFPACPWCRFREAHGL